MRVDDLPQLGVITNPRDGEFFGEWSDLEGKDLLCLGLSEEQIDRFIAPHAPNSVHILTLWADHVDAVGGRYPLVIGDITKDTDFKDDTFDAVLTMSLLEHVSDVGAALDEMARVTRPGGTALHVFGPAWTSVYGHHLCTAHDHPMMNFYRWQMPAHMHLLCSETEVAEYYDELGLGADLGRSVFDAFHHNEHINRIAYDAYVSEFHRFQVVRTETMYHRLPPEHLRRLRGALPLVRDFSTYGGCYELVY